MDYSSEEMESLRKAWQIRAIQKQEELGKLRREAISKASAAATHLKEKYQVKSVYLYGSLAWGKHFDHRSDIDLLVEEFPIEANYWKMIVELEAITTPVEVNVVLSEDASPGLRNKARREGKPL